MISKRLICFLLAGLCLASLCGGVLAAEVDCDATYCFTAEDFSQNAALQGVCITDIPDSAAGTVLLGSRVILPGDILTTEQLSQMTFAPLRTQEDQSAQVCYLPIYSDRVETSAAMTISIRGKQDNAPVAEDFSIETYKNLPNSAALKVKDPEGQALTYSVMRQPKRGQVTVAEDGTFTYTPKKNKVGVDSFTYTAADPAGNVSREATVTVQILKPTDSKQYTDTTGESCRFAAEWMRNTGLFVGEQVGGEDCFQPDKAVSRGEFITMAVKVLQIPEGDPSYSAVPADTPVWLRPYLAAAIRAGLTADLPASDTGSFEAAEPITGAQAAVVLQNALGLRISAQALEDAESVAVEEKQELPVWAAASLTAMEDNGILLAAEETLSRGQVAELMYQVSQMAEEAPGMQVIRMNRQ